MWFSFFLVTYIFFVNFIFLDVFIFLVVFIFFYSLLCYLNFFIIFIFLVPFIFLINFFLCCFYFPYYFHFSCCLYFPYKHYFFVALISLIHLFSCAYLVSLPLSVQLLPPSECVCFKIKLCWNQGLKMNRLRLDWVSLNLLYMLTWFIFVENILIYLLLKSKYFKPTL